MAGCKRDVFPTNFEALIIFILQVYAYRVSHSGIVPCGTLAYLDNKEYVSDMDIVQGVLFE